MEFIEKFLFIHDSQIKRWGKQSAFLNILFGFIFFIGAFYFYYWVIAKLEEVKVSLTALGNQYDPLLGGHLAELTGHLDDVFLGVFFILLALGLAGFTIGILYLKLYKVAKNA